MAAALHTGAMKSHLSPKYQVYLVEDSALIRERLLTRLGALPLVHVVGFATTVREAIEGIDGHTPDAVILDLKLADGTGLTVLKHLKEHLPGVLVIVLTNYAVPYIQDICMKGGAAFFLDKTAELGRLLEIVQTLSTQQKTIDS